MASGSTKQMAAAVAELTDPQYIKRQLPAATHVLVHEQVCRVLTVACTRCHTPAHRSPQVTLCGLRIYGCSWLPWHAGTDAGDDLPDRVSRALCLF